MGGDTTISTNFKAASRASLEALINRRAGEVKIGERVAILYNENEIALSLHQSDANFVLLGIPEDIGVRANGGVGGAHTAWTPALKALLNMQSTAICSGADLLVLGAFDFSDWMKASLDEDLDALRQRVAAIDETVAPLIQLIVAAGKMPIVIGGGHNNAFPLLKGASLAKGMAINCINLDAHSDYRVMEGRHSGNGFRYAKDAGYLSRYSIVGLHRPYNSHAVLADIRKDANLQCSFYEDIFLNESLSFRQAVDSGLKHTAGSPVGIELDLDCIAGVLSSAATPCGITSLQARQYLQQCMSEAEVAYVHLTEGAVELRDGRSDGSTAKALAYFIYDILSARV